MGLRLQPYSFTIKYRPGIENIEDYISRHPIDENLAERYVNFIMETSLLRAIDFDTLREETQNCATIQRAIFFTQEVGSGINCTLIILKMLT